MGGLGGTLRSFKVETEGPSYHWVYYNPVMTRLWGLGAEINSVVEVCMRGFEGALSGLPC